MVLLLGALIAAARWIIEDSTQPAVPIADTPTETPSNTDQRWRWGTTHRDWRSGAVATTRAETLVGQPLGSTPLGAATLKRLTVRLTDGHIAATGDAAVAGTTAPFITATPGVANNRATVRVDEAHRRRKSASPRLPASRWSRRSSHR